MSSLPLRRLTIKETIFDSVPFSPSAFNRWTILFASAASKESVPSAAFVNFCQNSSSTPKYFCEVIGARTSGSNVSKRLSTRGRIFSSNFFCEDSDMNGRVLSVSVTGRGRMRRGRGGATAALALFSSAKNAVWKNSLYRNRVCRREVCGRMVMLSFAFLLIFPQLLAGDVDGWGQQKCCELIVNVDEFGSCVAQSDERKSNVAIAMFASDKTMNYSPYTILINSYYCSLKKYNFKLFLDVDTPFSFSDKRWNKIGIVVDAFREDGWGRNLDYLVVIDADLIVTDFSLDIGSVVSNSPMAHLIMSRDAADIANSGFLIVKNSEWALRFFSMWWAQRSLSTTDQSAFNDLFQRLNAPAEIALLPPGELNSEYPVYQTFSPQSRVLHLFGEIDEIRSGVFRSAASELCRHLSEPPSKKRRGPPKRQPLQLGLSSAKLAEIAFAQISLRRNRLKSHLVECVALGCGEDELGPLMEGIQSETSSLCGYGRGILADQSSKECLSLALENADLIKPFALRSPSSVLSLDHFAQNLYAAFTWSEDSLETLKRGEEVCSCLSSVE
jgi:hypothetical protein